jgi:hypothetical protein
MMTPSPAGKFEIENDEEGTHRNMQEHEYRSPGFLKSVQMVMDLHMEYRLRTWNRALISKNQQMVI